MKKYVLALVVSVFSISCTHMGPVNATNNDIGSKSGKACDTRVLFFPISGTDASIYKAATSGGIKKISTVDFQWTNYVFYQQMCTVVRGS